MRALVKIVAVGVLVPVVTVASISVAVRLARASRGFVVKKSSESMAGACFIPESPAATKFCYVEASRMPLISAGSPQTPYILQ